MKKKTTTRPVEELLRTFNQINFPEYQREPNIWDRRAKQRLIDSISREFDIASLYFYLNVDDVTDCIDGRQRLNTLLSFVGRNPDDPDNGFAFSQINDIFQDVDRPFSVLDGLSYGQISERNDDVARQFVDRFIKYEVTVVELSGSRRPEEFNLQFTRLNLGVIINSGEKLHAMVGDMRNVCFDADGIGAHQFLEAANIPTRRYALEQTAAQILCQVFSLSANDGFARTRHYDLQGFFARHTALTEEQRELVARLRTLLDLLADAFGDTRILRNRAITVSAVLLAWRIGIRDAEEAQQLADFLSVFLKRLQWQVKKGLDVDDEYRYLIDFQRHLTQASVERPAVEARATVLEREFRQWVANSRLSGDEEYRINTGRDSNADSEERG